jgi:hypothetical protein
MQLTKNFPFMSVPLWHHLHSRTEVVEHFKHTGPRGSADIAFHSASARSSLLRTRFSIFTARCRREIQICRFDKQIALDVDFYLFIKFSLLGFF